MEALRPHAYKIVPGLQYGTPKEMWGFRTAPRRAKPRDLAREFLAANAEVLGLERQMSRLRFARARESLGARHVIHQQVFDDKRIHRAYVTVHVDRTGRVYLAKNRALPRDRLEPEAPFRRQTKQLLRRAIRELPPPHRSVHLVDHEKMWFPLEDRLRPAIRFRLKREAPREECVIFVDAANARVLSAWDNLSVAAPFARIFDPNPVIELGGTRGLLGPRGGVVLKVPDDAYRTVRLGGHSGGQRLDGRRVSTSITRPLPRAKPRQGRYDYESDTVQFAEVMAYFHVDAVIAYLERLGFRGPHAIFTEPIEVDAHGTKDDNSWYSPSDRTLTFGTGGVDDAQDGEIVVHELGHAIQDAIVPGFGQSLQAAAMGEGFGDYLAASFFEDRKPARYKTSFGSWDGVRDDTHDPHCVRRVDERLTFEAFEAEDDWEHENGMIWSSALWEVREVLGQEGADRVIVESHYQLDGFTTFARGARAILDANHHLRNGRDAERLRGIFRRRGIGPVD